jgi:hypothetical protein
MSCNPYPIGSRASHSREHENTRRFHQASNAQQQQSYRNDVARREHNFAEQQQQRSFFARSIAEMKSHNKQQEQHGNFNQAYATRDLVRERYSLLSAGTGGTGNNRTVSAWCNSRDSDACAKYTAVACTTTLSAGTLSMGIWGSTICSPVLMGFGYPLSAAFCALSVRTWRADRME